MATEGRIVLKLDAREFNRCVDAAIARMEAMSRKVEPADPLPLVVASAAAAAVGCARPVSRRSFFGLRLW